MTREWKPGDVALVTYDGDRTKIAIHSVGTGAGCPVWESGTGYLMAHRIESIRPLVVIDAEDREQVERLLRAYYMNLTGQPDAEVDDDLVASLSDALREFANPTPPKPDEPTGLGAVVEDAEGCKWIRSDSVTGDGHPWVCDGLSDVWSSWGDFAAVRILSAGVES